MLALAGFPSMQDRDMLATARLWEKLLSDLEYELAEAALAKILMTARFFPTVADIREAAVALKPRPDEAPPAADAWEEVRKKISPYRAAEWSHPLIGRAVSVIGGRTLCEAEYDMSRRFMDIYETLRRRQKDEVENKAVAAIMRADIRQLTQGIG